MTLGYRIEKIGSSSNLDAKEDQDFSGFNVFAVVSVWLNKFNNKNEEYIDEVEAYNENQIEETADSCRIINHYKEIERKMTYPIVPITPQGATSREQTIDRPSQTTSMTN